MAVVLPSLKVEHLLGHLLVSSINLNISPDVSMEVEHGNVHPFFCPLKFLHGMEGQQKTTKEEECVNAGKTVEKNLVQEILANLETETTFLS